MSEGVRVSGSLRLPLLQLTDCGGAGFDGPDCRLGGPAVRDGAGAGFPSYHGLSPTPRPPWYSNRA